MMGFRSRAFLLACVCGQGFLSVAEANVLGTPTDADPSLSEFWFDSAEVKSEILSMIDHDKKYSSVTEVSVRKATDALRSMYTALPKNKRGLLDSGIVRYALHRYFLKRHAMYLKGVESMAHFVNTTSPEDVRQEDLPAFMQRVFEDRLPAGFDLHALALLAVSIERAIHDEAQLRLFSAYSSAGLSTDENITAAQLGEVMTIYTYSLFIGYDEDVPVNESMLQLAHLDFPAWRVVQRYMELVQKDVLKRTVGTATPGDGQVVTYLIAVRTLAAFTERFGFWHSGECESMARELTGFEVQGTGRLLLTDFYQAGRRYTESKDFLLAVGAGEKISAGGNGSQQVRVIIPNYVASLANCVSSTALFGVCCANPCEKLLGAVEAEVAAPKATARQIADIVANLASRSVEAPRNLSDTLKQKLDEISLIHRGYVPLHGRLFAQWMHYAYPRECPFPAVSGTTRPMTPADWMSTTNSSASLTQEEVDKYLMQAKAQMAQMQTKDLTDGDWEHTLPWLEEEEMLFPHRKVSLKHELKVVFHATSMISIVAVILNAVFSAAKAAKRSWAGDSIDYDKLEY